MAKAASEIKVKDIMTTKVTAALAGDSVLDASRLMIEKKFEGLPVVDKDHKLLGMLTMKELLDQEGLYLPTIVRIFNEMKISHPEDVSPLRDKLKTAKNLKVGSVMNDRPAYLLQNASLEQAVEAFLLRRESPLPVVDQAKKLVGILSKSDVLKMLTRPFESVTAREDLTMENEPIMPLKALREDFVVVSKTRVRFWYLAFFVFLLLGFVLAIAGIIRVRIL